MEDDGRVRDNKKGGTGMTYKLETLGATLRIIDETTGGDVAILGRADDPKVREFGEFAIQALNTWAYVT